MINSNCKIHPTAKIYNENLVNLYGCEIGEKTTVGPFVEIQKGAKIGKNCKISTHSFICEGVTIEDNVFIGHGVIFTNDKQPRAVNEDGNLATEQDWELLETLVNEGASIGSNATILPGIVIGKTATIGAGAVVTRNVEDNTVVAGNPARPLKQT